MTTFFDDGYQDTSKLMPGHRVNHKAEEVQRLWREASAVLDLELTATTEQEKEVHQAKRLRLEAMANAIERGGLELVEGDAPMCPCRRGRVAWHGLCSECQEDNELDPCVACGELVTKDRNQLCATCDEMGSAKAERDTAASVRETRSL